MKVVDEGYIKNKWEELNIKRRANMHLYLHAPFCVGVCKYCMYKSVDMKDVGKEEYARYFKGLLEQVKNFRSVMESKPADTLYFGGGTPSIMPFEILGEIVNNIPHFDNIRIKVFEANPVSMTINKIDELVDLGFTYLALGVQTLNPLELEKQNRMPPKKEHLKMITQYALDRGLHVNYDLMTLLEDNLTQDMARVYSDLMIIMREYKPPSIDIYPMDQKLNRISDEEKIRKVVELRKTLKKALFFNKDYHIAGGNGFLNLNNTAEILKNYKGNYHLLSISDEEFYGNRKGYSCSGPNTAPSHQNVLSFGGYQDLWSYSYFQDKEFIYHTKINSEGKSIYKVERGL